MKTKLILAVLAVVLSGALIGSCKCQAPVVAINPSSAVLPQDQIGTIFQANITVTNVTGLWSFDFRVNWNPQVLNYTDGQQGEFLKDVGSTISPPPTIKTGYLPDVSSILLIPSTANGSGVLYTLNFTVLAAGVSDITLNESTMNTYNNGAPSSIEFTTSNGEVSVVPEFPSAMILIIVFVMTTVAIIAKKRTKAPKQ